MSQSEFNVNTDLRCDIEAAMWCARLTELGQTTSVDFEAWFARSEDNRTAWRKLKTHWDGLDEFAASPELIDIRQAALRDAKGALRLRFFGTTGRKVAAALIGCVILAGAFYATHAWINGADSYSTGRGERFAVSLKDGSRLTLDAETEVRVEFSAAERALQLVKGQARFDVAHDARRPFAVTAGNQKILAVGTAFDVQVSDADISVTLLKGKVLVLDKECCASGHVDAAAPAQLAVGDQFIAKADRKSIVRKVVLEKATAWERGEIIFDNTPLSDVVQQIGRYSTMPIFIADPKVATLRVSGVFKTDDTKGLIETLSRYMGILSVEQDGKIAIYLRG